MSWQVAAPNKVRASPQVERARENLDTAPPGSLKSAAYPRGFSEPGIS